MTPAFVVPLVATTANTRSAPPGQCSGDRSPQRRTRHPAALVGRHEQRLDIHDEGGRLPPTSAHLRMRARIPPKPMRDAPAASRHRRRAATSALRLPAVPPETNTPPAPSGKPDEVGDPAQRLVLGEHGAGTLHPRAPVDRRRSDDEIEQDRRLGRCGGHEREEPGVVDRDARRCEHVGEQPERFEATDPVLGDGLTDAGLQILLRSRLVERRRVEVGALDGVADDRLGQALGGAVRAMHPHRMAGDGIASGLRRSDRGARCPRCGPRRPS